MKNIKSMFIISYVINPQIFVAILFISLFYLQKLYELLRTFALTKFDDIGPWNWPYVYSS